MICNLHILILGQSFSVQKPAHGKARAHDNIARNTDRNSFSQKATQKKFHMDKSSHRQNQHNRKAHIDKIPQGQKPKQNKVHMDKIPCGLLSVKALVL